MFWPLSQVSYIKLLVDTFVDNVFHFFNIKNMISTYTHDFCE